ncbi:hypothetical protein ABSL23_16430 (plasmid) [Halobacterium sp. NMX12-1]|uniref:DUF8068 domain-containing protein n=1 Tax=Halobacterium sp. NMX12-1 TaxID=3166650 RepID=A0AAU8CIA2_9EURY
MTAAHAAGRQRPLLPEQHPQRVRVAAVAATLAAVVAAAGLRIAGNAPPTAATVPSDALDAAATTSLVIPAAAAVAVAVTTDDNVERVGLLSVGVFAGLTAVSAAATVPAAGAIAGGGALAVGSRGTWTDNWRAVRRALVAGVILASVAFSLGGAVGLAPTFSRPVGSELYLVGVAGAVLFARPGRAGWIVGGLAAGAVLYAASAAPFAAGAAVLVAGAAVDVSGALLAAGVAGATAATVGGLRARNVPAAVGAATVLFAGVPATPARAAAVVLGISLLAWATDPAPGTGVGVDE